MPSILSQYQSVLALQFSPATLRNLPDVDPQPFQSGDFERESFSMRINSQYLRHPEEWFSQQEQQLVLMANVVAAGFHTTVADIAQIFVKDLPTNDPTGWQWRPTVPFDQQTAINYCLLLPNDPQDTIHTIIDQALFNDGNNRFIGGLLDVQSDLGWDEMKILRALCLQIVCNDQIGFQFPSTTSFQTAFKRYQYYEKKIKHLQTELKKYPYENDLNFHIIDGSDPETVKNAFIDDDDDDPA